MVKLRWFVNYCKGKFFNLFFLLNYEKKKKNHTSSNLILKFSDPSMVNQWDSQFQTPLLVVFDKICQCITSDDKIPMIKTLLDNGANINAQTGEKRETLLHIAIKKKQVILIIHLYHLLKLQKKKKKNTINFDFDFFLVKCCENAFKEQS